MQRRHRLAYVFISHDLRVVRALANHLLVMKGGRVVEAGPARRVFADPRHPYTRASLAAALNLEAGRWRRGGDPDMNGADNWVELFADGACSGNPGPGGWGVLLRYRGHEKELSGGEPDTTNNRMELLAAISGLEALKRPTCSVRITTD